MNLAIQMRPIRFGEMFGNTKTLNQVRKLFASEPKSAVLITGETGVGKTTLAMLLAHYVNCENITGFDLCGQCEACLDEELATDVVTIDCGTDNRKSVMESLQELTPYLPSFKKRVFILNEVQRLGNISQSALLDLLERKDVAKNNMFLLTTNEPDKLKRELTSRCFSIHLGQPTIAERTDFVIETLLTQFPNKDEDWAEAKTNAHPEWLEPTSFRQILVAMEASFSGTAKQSSTQAQAKMCDMIVVAVNAIEKRDFLPLIRALSDTFETFDRDVQAWCSEFRVILHELMMQYAGSKSSWLPPPAKDTLAALKKAKLNPNQVMFALTVLSVALTDLELMLSSSFVSFKRKSAANILYSTIIKRSIEVATALK